MVRPPRRLLAALVVVLALAGCKSELFTDLSENEANQIVAALLGAGIPASKTSGPGDGVTVMVEDARFGEAVALLEARGLPADRYASFGDVFEKDGIVSSPVEERARYIYALSQELSHTIAEIDGVLSARIHVVLPETDMLGRDFQPSSASVFIRHVPDAPATRYTSQIRLLVANSIEGLAYDNVNVVAIPAEAVADPATSAPVLRDVVGIWVHPASVQRLRIAMGAMAAVAALSLGVAGFVLLSRRGGGRADEEFDRA